jgi:NAD(P)-dependent dehydrogenase (short-subunit alcohol dehydrogenase family)
MQTLLEQVFIVAGGAGAIGGAIVGALREAGARVVVADRHAAEGVLAVDLSRPEGAEQMVKATLAQHGRLDGVISTVGGFAMGKLHEAPLADYDRMFDLNVRTLYHVARAVVPHFLGQRRGFLAGFASEPAWTGAAPGMSLYAASKAAVATLLRSLDGELQGTDVQVAIVYPMGAVDTPANRKDMPGFDRFIDPNEIAATLVHAASRSRAGRLLELPVFPPR